MPNKFWMHAGQLSPQTNLIPQLWNCFENGSTDGVFLYGDPVPSIGVYIKLNQIQTKTNLMHMSQWKVAQNSKFVRHSTEIIRQTKKRGPLYQLIQYLWNEINGALLPKISRTLICTSMWVKWKIKRYQIDAFHAVSTENSHNLFSSSSFSLKPLM